MHHEMADHVDWEPAPSEHFTGQAWFGAMHQPTDPDDLNVLGVRFEPGARSDWHSHPAGQVLFVLEGTARVQTEDGEVAEAGPGDAVYAPPGEMHWHGATSDAAMIHLSITYGGATEWEPRKVTDEEYGE
jgi:quercetin dioxygenase-like cupin family protein